MNGPWLVHTKIKWIDMNGLKDIANKVSEITGYIFDDYEIDNLVSYTKRKCMLNGKDEEYAQLMFEDELYNYLASFCINRRYLAGDFIWND